MTDCARGLSELEWLGVEMALCHWMGGKPAQHRLCVTLLRARGRLVSYDDLRPVVGRRAPFDASKPNANINKAAERLRNQLGELGLSRMTVVTAAGEGLRILPHDASAILSALNDHFGGKLLAERPEARTHAGLSGWGTDPAARILRPGLTMEAGA